MQGIIIFVMCLVSGGLLLIAYRLGVIDGQKLAKGRDMTFSLREEEYEPSEQDIKMQTLLNNIDTYDGTDRGQVKL